MVQTDGLNDPALDKCIEEAGATYESEDRHRLHKLCQELACEGAWFEPIWTQPGNSAASRKVKAVLPSWGADWELREARLGQQRRQKES